MGWIRTKDNRSWIQKVCTQVLKQGRLPGHVGFILDGNRRYAKERKMKPVEGHKSGFDKLSETLRWCLDLGIKEVTVYVFSIENFKRSEEEVGGLMELAKEKFTELLSERESLRKEGICIQVVGDWSLVPQELRPLMAKAMTMTRFNSKAKLNIAFAYTSRNEITRGIESIHNGLVHGDLENEDINCKLLEECFYILPSKPLDLLVRSSGETRLSDFLLWQSTETVLCFTNVLWPEFTYWHLLGVILQYQKDKMNLLHVLSQQKPDPDESFLSSKQSQFIDKIREAKWRVLEAEASRLL